MIYGCIISCWYIGKIYSTGYIGKIYSTGYIGKICGTSIYNYYSEVACLPVPHKQFLPGMYIVVSCGVVNVSEHHELCV